MDNEEKRRQKAREQRYRKPAVKGLCFADMREELWDISEACGDVHWYWDADGSLASSLIGEEEDEEEIRVMFSSLEADCERMRDDLEGMDGELFDLWFAGIGMGRMEGMYGYDEYEEDYFGLEPYMYDAATREAEKKLLRMTKKDIIDNAGYLFQVVLNYLSIRSRYHDLESSLDILKGGNALHLDTVRKLEELYEKASEKYPERADVQAFDQLLATLPQEAFL